MRFLDVSLAEQVCRLKNNNQIEFEARVSTAANGAGEQKNSGCTPTGWHQVRACIGAEQPINSVFVGRRPTGEIYSAELGAKNPERDWILTRILWLSGLEVGKNRLAKVDTMQRYIYIHGCPDELPMGIALSHGCIRMHNHELLTLFDLVVPGMKVFIHE